MTVNNVQGICFDGSLCYSVYFLVPVSVCVCVCACVLCASGKEFTKKADSRNCQTGLGHQPVCPRSLPVSYLLSTGFLSGDGLDAREPAVNKTDTVPVLMGLNINSRTWSQNLSPPIPFQSGALLLPLSTCHTLQSPSEK